MILLNVFEVFFGIIFAIGMIFLFLWVPQWIMAKYFGTRFYGKFQAGKAYEQQDRLKLAFEKYIQTNPELVEKAIQRCNSKGYSKTHENILSEIHKIENELNNVPTIKEKIENKISNIVEKLKKDNSLSNLEKLEKLGNLRKQGTITEDEFLEFKKSILKDFPKISEKTDESKSIEIISNLKRSQFEQDKKNAMRIINSLFFEFKDQLIQLQNIDLAVLHEIILSKGNTISLINNYEQLFKLFSDGLLTEVEFIEKKKQLLIKSLNN